MEGSYPRKLRAWDSATRAVIEDLPDPIKGRTVQGPHHPAEFAERLYECEALAPARGGRPLETGPEPYTLQWFLSIENHRHGRQGKWIPRLLEFAKHSGETLLGLGNGLGTDWLQYARHGAMVVVCSPSSEHLELTRCNFQLRGLGGRFLHASPDCLPLEAASIDVACVSSLLHEVADPQRVIREVYRVLKPGGKVLAVVPACYDVDFWFHLCFPWKRWLSPGQGRTDPDQVRFSGRKLNRLFDQFIEHRIYKRQLRRSQVPHLWRWAPMTLLERCMGRVLVLKAFKPLSAAISLQAAA